MSAVGDKFREIATAMDAFDVEWAARMAAINARLARLETLLAPPVVVPPTPVVTLKPLSADPIPAFTLTDDCKDPVYGTPLKWVPNSRRHYYSTRSPWSDGGRLLTWDGRSWFVDNVVVPGLTGNCDIHWYAEKLLHTGANGTGGKWYLTDPASGTKTLFFDLAGTLPGATHYWTGGMPGSGCEGKLSDDLGYFAVHAHDGTKSLGIAVVSLSAAKVVSKLALPSTARVDHVTISRTGQYVIVADKSGLGLLAYTRSLTGVPVKLHSASTHAAACLTPDGKDCYVLVDHDRGFLRGVMMDGTKFDMSPLWHGNGQYYGLHVSGTGPAGQVLLSADGDGGGTLQPGYRKVWSAEVKPGGLQWNICHHRSSMATDWSRAHAAMSPDGKWAIFASDSGKGGAWIAGIR